ncbi:ATP-binding cassette domain-containing protein [Bordetella hinzii]|uniref:Type I secretion system ATPase n=1 Tax=Bordetella hinzii OH87 BAL007II TaxID=1331262 RepID=A0ABR4QW32_9BORD|nr:ATP-binding cassette domain-containing protein [Bordetella hinzii]KCB21968.1 type I secretion system ATPase [Bordetella hinzii OH87 BAL007II]KCB33557.1 type I secretion system ATPase [Bordetella hinzii CA90 BAL1384]KCB39521.1 type I secretion system ATPase [Bordetella hinzii 5132]QDJ42347.1 protease/lipase ABC transporter ATP-binding protein [Bordetella hinzii]QDJ46915.1 protease/lipase ABC transporter ATP-binding protein [Bordetella hinzii]
MRTRKGGPGALGWVTAALWRRRTPFAEALVATTVANLLALGTSMFSMQVYDRVIPSEGHQTLWVLTVGVSLAVILEFLLRLLRGRMQERVASSIDQTLSRRFFERMLNVRMEARPPTVGTLASQIKGFELVRGVLTAASLLVLADVPFALLYIAVIALVGSWVALVPLAVAPLALAAGLGLQALVRRHARIQQTAANQKAGLLVEAVDGAESLKANGGERMMQARWNTLVDEAAIAERQSRDHGGLAQQLTVSLQQLGYVATIAFGAWLVSENQITMGGLLACSILSNRALAPLIQLPGVMMQWAHARVALDSLDQLLALANEEDDREQALKPGVVEPSMRFERVRFAYARQAQPALDLERLDIRPGERIGVLGPVGSGKSTLLKLASTLYRPQEGRIFLSNLDAGQIDPAVARAAVGYLPQDLRLFSGTLRDNLLLGLPDPGDAALLEAARRTGLARLISGQSKGLALPIAEGGRGISGGQKQQLALTRFLLAGPSMWLLDEPTGAMDADNEALVVRLLQEELQSGKRSALIATHKTALLPLFTRLIVMYGGRIVLDGPRQEVMAKLSAARTPAEAVTA